MLKRRERNSVDTDSRFRIYVSHSFLPLGVSWSAIHGLHGCRTHFLQERG